MSALQAPQQLLDLTKIKWFRKRLLTWHPRNTRSFPWRDSKSPYEILIAEMLLQATSATKVIAVYKTFIERYRSVFSLATAEQNDIERIIRPLGLPNRAHAILNVARLVVDLHAGEIPCEKDELLKLPRVGEYTAGAVLSFGYGVRVGIPDTNVIRLIQRFFNLENPRKSHRGSPSRSIRLAAAKVVPTRNSGGFNYAMLDFGALICTSLHPKCKQCPLSTKCETYMRQNNPR